MHSVYWPNKQSPDVIFTQNPFHFQICSELQEFHGSIDAFLKNTDSVTLQDIENLALKEDKISSKVKKLKEQQEFLEENIRASLLEAINIMEQSLDAVRKKMYGDFGDHSSLTSTAQKVQQMKEIVEGQLKEASEQINSTFEDSNQILTHLEESLQTGEEDIVFAQNKLKSRTTSLCKEGLAFEVSKTNNFLKIFSNDFYPRIMNKISCASHQSFRKVLFFP